MERDFNNLGFLDKGDKLTLNIYLFSFPNFTKL